VKQGEIAGYFLPGQEGPVFVLRRGPPRSRACVIVAAPFAEEMNKTRRMVTLVAARLANQGITVILPDYYGTGDSAGDFSDATVARWRADLAVTAGWCADEFGPVRGMLAVRLGCALASDTSVLNALPGLRHSVLWQPVFDGAKFVTQFLRMRVAAAMANGKTETVAELRRQAIEQGEIEVAGYRLSARLLAELDELIVPSCLPAGLGAVSWCEIVRDVQSGLPLPSQRLVQATQGEGGSLATHALAGEPFWASTEIVTNGDLVDVTCSALAQSLHESGATT